MTKIIDLRKTDKLIKSKIRKSYKSLISWGYKEMKILTLGKKNIEWQDILNFRDLHIREAGRETRSIDSWRMQYEAIKNDEAFAVFAYYKEKLVSAGWFSFGDGHCHYGVSASRRDLFDKPLFHAPMYSAILYAKNLGLNAFETGFDYNLKADSSVSSSKKERQISLFKAGFGDDLIPLLVAYGQNK